MIEYNWDQTFYHITIEVPFEIKPSKKDIDIVFKPKYLSIKIFDKIIDGKLFNNILPDESTWYLEENKLCIELAKVETKDFEGYWNKCFEYETEIYTQRPGYKHPSRKLRNCSDDFIKEKLENYYTYRDSIKPT